MQYEVRAPYKGVDKYSNVLPVAYGKLEISESDLSKSMPEISKTAFKDALKAAIQGAGEIAHGYRADGYIDDANNKVIWDLINLASKYSKQADEISKWWETEYSPDPDKEIYGWSIQDEKMRGCPYLAPNKGSLYMDIGNGAEMVDFTCPTEADKINHDKDRSAYQQLLLAALMNARCAQEAAATVGTYSRNKEVFDSVSGGRGLSNAPKRTGKSITANVPPKSSQPEEETDPETDTSEEMDTSEKPKKKKDNTILLAAAGILGLLMMKGKK